MFFSHEDCKLPCTVSKTCGNQRQLLCMRFSGTIAARSTYFMKKDSDPPLFLACTDVNRWAVRPMDSTTVHGLPWQFVVGCLLSFESTWKTRLLVWSIQTAFFNESRCFVWAHKMFAAFLALLLPLTDTHPFYRPFIMSLSTTRNLLVYKARLAPLFGSFCPSPTHGKQENLQFYTRCPPRCYSPSHPRTKGGIRCPIISNGGGKSIFNAPLFFSLSCGGIRHTLLSCWSRRRGRDGPRMAWRARRDSSGTRRMRRGNGLGVLVDRSHICTNQAWFHGDVRPRNILFPGVIIPIQTSDNHENVPSHASSNANKKKERKKTNHEPRLRRLCLRSLPSRIAPSWSSTVQLHPLFCSCTHRVLPHPRFRCTTVLGFHSFLCFSEVSEGRGWRDHQIHPLSGADTPARGPRRDVLRDLRRVFVSFERQRRRLGSRSHPKEVERAKKTAIRSIQGRENANRQETMACSFVALAVDGDA